MGTSIILVYFLHSCIEKNCKMAANSAKNLIWVFFPTTSVLPSGTISITSLICEGSNTYKGQLLGIHCMFLLGYRHSLVTARAFMLASLIVIPYTILEISRFLGQLPVYHWRRQRIAPLRSELFIVNARASPNSLAMPEALPYFESRSLRQI